MKNSSIQNEIHKSTGNEINCKKLKIYSVEIIELIIKERIGFEKMIIIPEDELRNDSENNKMYMIINNRIVSI